jgi:magnesium chelatase family protein
VHTAREHQWQRQSCYNAQLQGKALDRHCAVDQQSQQFLRVAAERLGFSARTYHRLLRIARSIADLEEVESIRQEHLAEAIQYRRLANSLATV